MSITRTGVNQLRDDAKVISYPVADQTARFALTTNEVQNSDFVIQLDNGQWYLVIDQTQLGNINGYYPVKALPVLHAASHAPGSADAIATGTTSTTVCIGNDGRLPTTDEKAALVGTNGTPSASNKFATNSDPRFLPYWAASTSYTVGQHVIYNNLVYRCITANSDSSFTAAKWYALGAMITGATSVADGVAGIFPAPTAGQQNYIAYGDGTWKQGNAAIVQAFLFVGDKTSIGMTNVYQQIFVVPWPGSSALGTPTNVTFVLENKTATSMTVYFKVVNLETSTNFVPEYSGTLGANATAAFNTTTINTAPTTISRLSIQVKTNQGSSKQIAFAGGSMRFN